MIVSYSNKYIFLKTYKTAGTSLEIALNQYCGSKDVVTVNTLEDEIYTKDLGLRGAQNYRKTASEILTLKPRKKSLVDLMERRWPRRILDHSTAGEAREFVGSRAWASFEKIAVVRNPFDRCVSLYHWISRVGFWSGSFEDMLRERPDLIVQNRKITHDSGSCAVQRWLKFEDLNSGVRDLELRYQFKGLTELFQSISAKGGSRPKRDYRDYYSEESRSLVSILNQWEIEKFGYTF